MKGGLDELMKKAQQVQDDLRRAQEEIARLEVTGESGAGLVRITLNGARDVKRVQIAPELGSDDRTMIEDLVAAAFNDANRKLEKLMQERMSRVTSSLGLPGGMRLPF
jgi:hypothetical protein